MVLGLIAHGILPTMTEEEGLAAKVRKILGAILGL
jgi:hypothetical protein